MVALHLFIILPLVLFAFLSSLFYVAPPIRYGYHSLGEVFVGINMGSADGGRHPIWSCGRPA